MTRFEGLNR